jgi:hypothetical protein
MTSESIVARPRWYVLDPEDHSASESLASDDHTLISGLGTGAELSCEGQHNSHDEHCIAGTKGDNTGDTRQNLGHERNHQSTTGDVEDAKVRELDNLRNWPFRFDHALPSDSVSSTTGGGRYVRWGVSL